jgi:hypothetical protein
MYGQIAVFSQNGSYTGFEFDRDTTNLSPIVLSLEYVK